MLAMDVNGDGRINNGSELFSIAGGGAQQTLASLDSNGDGKLDAGDAAWSTLKIWTDRNQDAYASASELQSLSEAGFASINLTPINRDIGFVVPGQPAEIKVDTFNFTKYGMLHGKVITVSQDAITREKPTERAGGVPRATLSDSSEPQGQELVYSARVSLDRTQMQVEDKIVSLAPGMAVTVEIKTGQRRVIEYLLSPLLRYRHEAARER
jgi:hypothetical protein